MQEYHWPTDGRQLGERAAEAWGTTKAALPVGTGIDGEVIGLAEITALPPGTHLPTIGAHVTGVVIAHADHNHQVHIRLDTR